MFRVGCVYVLASLPMSDDLPKQTPVHAGSDFAATGSVLVPYSRETREQVERICININIE